MPPQLTPDQTALLRDVALPALKIEHETTKRVIQAIPPEKADYRPDPVGRTALELAWHIVASEKRFLAAIAAGGFDFSPIPRPESITTPVGVATWFDESFAAGLQKLQALGGEQLAKVLDFRGLFQAPAAAFIQISMNHTIHHRGQLTMYLRPMGAKVPSIYGESYDATQARLAGEGQAK
jgi:uncharacterized damage-inducible protein DinB